MGALDGLPGVVLLAVVVLVLAHVPADGGGVEEYLGTHEGGDAAGFGVPLVPADEDAEGGEAGFEHLVAEVAGGEVELLVVARVVGDVHLAVFAEVGAVGVDDSGGVVVEPLGALFEHRADEHHAQLLGQRHEVPRGGAVGDGLGEAEVLIALLVAEIERGKKLLEANDLCAAGGQLAHLIGVALNVLRFVFDAAQLRNSHFYFHRSGKDLRVQKYDFFQTLGQKKSNMLKYKKIYTLQGSVKKLEEKLKKGGFWQRCNHLIYNGW